MVTAPVSLQVYNIGMITDTQEFVLKNQLLCLCSKNPAELTSAVHCGLSNCSPLGNSSLSVKTAVHTLSAAFQLCSTDSISQVVTGICI